MRDYVEKFSIDMDFKNKDIEFYIHDVQHNLSFIGTYAELRAFAMHFKV